LTEFTKKLLLECEVPEKKLYLCPNNIDTSAYTPKFGGGRYVLYLGGLYRDKGVLTAAKACAQLPHIPFKFVGTGADEQHLREFITTHRLSNAEIVGFKAGQEKLDYLRNSMFTIIPSHYYETFCLVVVESYASGKPVIASATGSLPYLVQSHKTGLLFPPQDVNDLASKIAWLYDHPDQIENMGRNARNVVETQYDSRLRYPALEAIFKDVINSSRMN
jgi:glycosyltransferase involved in cell wall biosynthesis